MGPAPQRPTPAWLLGLTAPAETHPKSEVTGIGQQPHPECHRGCCLRKYRGRSSWHPSGARQALALKLLAPGGDLTQEDPSPGLLFTESHPGVKVLSSLSTSLLCAVTLGRSLELSEPQFPPL